MKNLIIFISLIFFEFNISAKESLIEKVYIFDYLTNECLNCDGTEDREIFKSIMEFKDSEEIIKWIFNNFDSEVKLIHSWFKNENKKKDLKQRYQNAFSALGFPQEGFYYIYKGEKLYYKEKKCFIWPDCYNAFMTYYDSKGNAKWKRISPFFGLPIYPFIKDKYIIFVGGTSDRWSCLIILSKETGKIVEVFSIKDWEFSYLGYDLYSRKFHCPFYKDGYIYLESSENCKKGEEENCRKYLNTRDKNPWQYKYWESRYFIIKVKF